MNSHSGKKLRSRVKRSRNLAAFPVIRALRTLAIGLLLPAGVLAAEGDAGTSLQPIEDSGIIPAEVVGSLHTELQNDTFYHDNQSDCYYEGEGDPDSHRDRFRSGFRSGVCLVTRWVDYLFGDEFVYDEEKVSGRVALGVEYDQYGGWDGSGRLRLRAPLNNLNNKLNIFIGRLDEETFLQDTQPDLPGAFGDGIFGSEDNTWLLGLGYRQSRKRNRGFSFSLGVRFPLDPYARVRYRYDKEFNQHQFMRFRQTGFWQADRGFGTTSRLNLFQRLGDDNLLRFDNSLTIAEKQVEGVKWYSGLILYHRLHGNHALSIQSFINGETGAEVSIRDYGFRLTWRRPIGREWLFLEAGPSITWPRERQTEDRQMSLGVSVLVEMVFGNYRYR